jgi:autotransporter-associated beta strand protein
MRVALAILMIRLPCAGLVLFAWSCLGGKSQAGTVAIYLSNGVDVVDEGNKCRNVLLSLGETVNTISGTSLSAFTSAMTGADALVFPQINTSPLGFFDTDTRNLITDFVQDGGLVVFSGGNGTDTLLNGLFGTSVTEGLYLQPNSSLNSTNALGTVYEGGLATLSSPNQVHGFTTSTIPVGALSIYEGSGQTTVMLLPTGDGNIAFLGFNWFQSGQQSWVDLMGTTLELTQTVNVWDGGVGNNLWTTTGNWSEGVTPTAGEMAIFSGSLNTTVDHDQAAGTAYAGITFLADASAFTITGNSLGIASGGSIVNESTSTQTFSVVVITNGNATFDAAAGNLLFNQQVSLGSGGFLTATGAGNTTFAGGITGSGGLIKSGGGTLFLGANDYQGGTELGGGTAVLGDDDAFGTGDVTVSADAMIQSDDDARKVANDVEIDAGATLTVDGGSDLELSGDLSGAGSLDKSGSATLRLSGSNSYSGTTTVSGGTLVGDAGSLQGDIVNDASVVFEQASDGAYAGVMSGSGSLDKAGVGTLILGGANTYTGPTSVGDGALVVNGSITSDTTVASGALLGGNGTIFGNVNNSGTVAAGNSIGTLTVGGTYTQASGSFLEVEIDAGGTTPGVHNDLVEADAATLNGGTVLVTASSGTYTAGSTYRFLSSASDIQGQFAGIFDDLPAFDAILGYDFDGGLYWAYFTLQADYPLFAQTLNQRAVAAYLESISGGASGDLEIVLDGLGTLAGDPAAMRGALDALNSQVDPTLAAIGLQNTTLVVQQLASQLRSGTLGVVDGGFAVVAPAASEPSGPIVLVSHEEGRRPQVVFVSSESPDVWRGWAFGYGLGGSAATDGNAAGLTYGMGGTLLGAERWFDEGRVGFYGGYQGTGLQLTGPVQTGQINGGTLGSYLYNDDGFNYYTLIGGLQFNGFETRRFVQFDGIDRVANGDSSGWIGYGYLERGVAFRGQRATLQPFAALQYIYLRQNGYTETGAGALNLTVAGVDANSLRSLVGGRLQFTPHTAAERRLLPEVRALWLHEFLATDVVVNSFFAPIGGSGFAVQGLDLGRDWAIVGGGLRYELPAGWQLYANYDAQVNTQQVFHVGSGGAQYAW